MLCVAGVLGSAPVAAQEGGFALDQLQPAPAGDVFFGVPSPFASGALTPRGYLMFNYGDRPARIAGTDAAVVSGQGWLRADVSLALWDRVLVSLALPLAIINDSDLPTDSSTTFTKLSAPEFGDVRLGLRGRLLGDEAGPIQLGLGGYLYLPTGEPLQYVGEGAVRGDVHAVLGGRTGDDIGFAWTATIGTQLRASDSPHVLTYGAGAALMFGGDTFQVGPELYGTTPLNDKTLVLSAAPRATTPGRTTLELLVGAKLRVLDGLTFGAAAGPGLLNAIGTPTYRVLGLVGWAPLAKPQPLQAPSAAVKDSDDDGISDDIDACPDEPGDPNPDPKKDGCPPADRDGDGVLDVEDACPTTAGLRNADATKNGCPNDKDNDGFHDGIDACPDTPGDASDDPTQNGCPGDSDGDGITNRRDACPDVAGPQRQNEAQNGCPDQAASAPKPAPTTAANDAQLLPTRIFFHVNGVDLTRASNANVNGALTALRDHIRAHPEYVLIEIQGHTDDEGTEESNLRLSQARAQAVRNWLVRNGIAASRLTTRGYGFSRPAADNRIRTGRQKNRRVQAVVLKRR